MDLYRLSSRPEDLLPLNLDHAFRNCVSLIEWPVRLLPVDSESQTVGAPKNRLDVEIRIENDICDNHDVKLVDGDQQRPRQVTLQPWGNEWEERLEKLRLEGYLDDMLLQSTDGR
jgi:tRNA A37 threonylcarbamoyladenosine biosynthesis protein TsaE